MIPEVRYVNHLGNEVLLNSSDVSCSVTDLMKWAYDTDDSNGRVRGFELGVERVTVPVAAVNRSKSSEVYACVMEDRRAVRPGRLYVGDWYVVCYVTGASFKSWWSSPIRMDLELTVEQHRWHRDTTEVITSRGDAAGLDFAYDFAYDYGYTSSSVVVEDAGYDAADLTIRFYGPCVDPYATVGTNTYSVSASLGEGDYLTVSTADKTVVLTRYDGDVENAFPGIEGEYFVGSGSYIFEMLPPGVHAVVWGGSYDLDVVVTENEDQLVGVI